MVLLLRHDDVCASVTMADAIAAMEDAFREEGEGGVILPPRTNMKAGKGWLRVGPVSLERSGWMGFKAMNLAPGHGVRYQVHLYRASSGELLAIMDAQHLTTLRTGATSAVEGSDVVLAAVKSSETVLYGEWLKPGMHVNSVGTARRDQREIDPVTFERSAITVVDTREGVFGEAGDAVAAKDVIRPDQVHELSELVVGKAPGRSSAGQITLFKSVGTGVQDIALAAKIYERAVEGGRGLTIDGFPIAKKG
jgi:ornithine cyclodeaminase/alanine dehydrogenase-like protein (mu-crystallin family)